MPKLIDKNEIPKPTRGRNKGGGYRQKEFLESIKSNKALVYTTEEIGYRSMHNSATEFAAMNGLRAHVQKNDDNIYVWFTSKFIEFSAPLED